ncbi:hypothetical protein LIA77_10904 [Sarocladium implicatum]|nr:hypothetical protein LIA77_10904 [Sarocladium implicatum]
MSRVRRRPCISHKLLFPLQPPLSTVREMMQAAYRSATTDHHWTCSKPGDATSCRHCCLQSPLVQGTSATVCRV